MRDKGAVVKRSSMQEATGVCSDTGCHLLKLSVIYDTLFIHLVIARNYV